jgi:hypothetical protein
MPEINSQQFRNVMPMARVWFRQSVKKIKQLIKNASFYGALPQVV